MDGDVAALAQRVGETLERLTGSASERLHAFCLRHLPVEQGTFVSQLSPPVVSARIARALELPADLRHALGAAASLYFSAADLIDDCADGDHEGPLGQALNDGCRLLFACQHLLAELPGVTPAARARLSAHFAAGGLRMAAGQEWDLTGADAPTARDPVEIARHKTGAEFAVVVAAPAIAAGLDPEPWEHFGEALGALGQTVSDYFDLFLHNGDDWAQAKPTLPIRAGLAHPRWGATLRELLAGARERPSRRAAGQQVLLRAGAAQALRQVSDALDGEMAAAADRAGDPAVLGGLRATMAEAVGGVLDALEVFVDEREPELPDLAADRARLRATVLDQVLTALDGAPLAEALAAGAALGDALPTRAAKGLLKRAARAERRLQRAPLDAVDALHLVPPGRLKGAAARFADALEHIDPEELDTGELARVVFALRRHGRGRALVEILVARPPEPDGITTAQRLRALLPDAAAPTAALRTRQTLRGTFGDLEQTAEIASALAAADALPYPDSVRRALVDFLDAGEGPLAARALAWSLL